jgi:hypothetical protein
MGLDSVELLLAFEQYFNIQIPDKEAEKIETVQDMVNTVSRHLNITSENFILRDTILKKLNTVLFDSQLLTTPLSYCELIFKTLDPKNKTTWLEISRQLDLQLPIPFMEKNNLAARVFGKGWIPRYNWETITTQQFITATCASNHEKLINKENLTTLYEILVVTTTITVDRLGVDFYEVQPEKSFVMDFGID